MNLIHHKLRSRRGASLSIALLLFLVCLAVASVVLAAGTAASGRLSELREADQRYYSVTSAAELVRDMIGGQTVTFTQTKTTVIDTSTDPEGNITRSDPRVSVLTTWDDSVVLQKATIRLLFGTDPNTLSPEEAWQLIGRSVAVPGLGAFRMTPAMTGQPADYLEAQIVTCNAELLNGDLVFQFSNNSGTDRFNVKLTCTPGAPRTLNVTSTVSTEGVGDAVRMIETVQRDVSVKWEKENCVIERSR